MDAEEKQAILEACLAWRVTAGPLEDDPRMQKYLARNPNGIRVIRALQLLLVGERQHQPKGGL